MKINKDNYPAFFLDYHEGNLSTIEVAELLVFVEQHPELKEELENFENIVIEDYTEYTFNNKSSLKKEAEEHSPFYFITNDNRENYFIRSIENDLNETEKINLQLFLQQHPQYQKEYSLFEKTIVLPDNTIVFENKESLKQKERKAIPFYYYVAAAASILLLFGLFFMNTDIGYEKKFAVIENIKKSTLPVVNNDKLTVAEHSQRNNPLLLQAKKLKTKHNSSLNNSVKQDNKQNILTNKNSIVPNDLIINNEKEKEPTKQEITTLNETVKKNALQNILPLNNKVNKAVEEIKSEPEYLSLKEIATTKIKEKVLDENVITAQKKNGLFKKLSGWDVAQVITKGISALTGRNLQVKPTYNNNGDVTAFAFEAGSFEIKKGR